MRTFLSLTLLITLLGMPLPLPSAEPFALPKQTEILFRDDSGRTWRMNARLHQELAPAKKMLYDALLMAKYEFKHETALDEAKSHLLSAWTKGEETLLLLVWSAGGYTYFSWGVFSE